MVNILFHNMPADTRYAFAVAKVRALESKMLDQGVFGRLLKASDSEEVVKIISDTEYGMSLNEEADPGFETAIDGELKRLNQLIKDIDPDPVWTNLLRWRYDAHNLKVLLKTRSLKPDSLEYLLPLGVIECERMKKGLAEGDLDFLPITLKDGVDLILADEGKEVEIDFIIDRSLFLYLSQEAERSKNPFLIALIQIMIDLTNLMTYLRIEGLENSKEIFERAFLDGGMIQMDSFWGDDGLPNVIGNSCYSELKNKLDSDNLALLEAEIDNFLIEFLKQTRQRAFGVEPLIGYILAKELEIKNLRLIFIGKANSLDEDKIKVRLRESYV